MKFDAIVANPPYSANWSADPKFIEDERFSAYGKLAPKSKADFAFIQHMIYGIYPVLYHISCPWQGWRCLTFS